MQISIWYILVAAILSFALGCAVTYAINAQIVAYFRRCAKAYEQTLALFQGSCRATLSDAWFKKVLRRFSEDVERVKAK